MYTSYICYILLADMRLLEIDALCKDTEKLLCKLREWGLIPSEPNYLCRKCGGALKLGRRDQAIVGRIQIRLSQRGVLLRLYRQVPAGRNRVSRAISRSTCFRNVVVSGTSTVWTNFCASQGVCTTPPWNVQPTLCRRLRMVQRIQGTITRACYFKVVFNVNTRPITMFLPCFKLVTV